MTPELREGMRSLNANPFFKLLLGRLELQRNALKGVHEVTRYQKVEDGTFVQQGIFWTGWVKREMERLTEAPAVPQVGAYEAEEQAFQEIDAMLERVGIELPQEAEK